MIMPVAFVTELSLSLNQNWEEAAYMNISLANVEV